MDQYKKYASLLTEWPGLSGGNVAGSEICLSHLVDLINTYLFTLE